MAAAVLVVDDEEAVAFTLAAILAQDGYEVEQATSVAQALATVADRRFDVVLLDLRVGGDSGLTVLERLRQLSPDTAVLILTGYGSMDTAIQALRDGASDYLLKPCDVDELKAAIARALAQRRVARVDADRESAGAELRQALDRALRARDDFLAIASHELKTPLSVVIGWAEYIQRQLARGAAEQAAEKLDVVVGRARHLARLVDDFIDVVRIQQGIFIPTLERLDLRTVVEQAVRDARSAHPDQDVRLTLPAEPVPVQADAGRLRQVFSQLLENAVKFSPGGGPVVVQAGVAEGAARVTVRDHGIGMPADELPHVFERFHQVERDALSRRFGGMGVGLYLSRAVVEAHGGRMQAESAGEGRGSTFTVTLPLMAD